MSFFSPEIAAPYRNLRYDYASEDERVTQDALNRAREVGAQQAARGGFKSPRGVALNTYNRLASDILNERAKREQENRLAYTRTMAALPMQPSTISSIGTPLLYGIGQGMGKDVNEGIGKAITKGVGNLWDLGTEGLTSAYQSLRDIGPSAASFAPTDYEWAASTAPDTFSYGAEDFVPQAATSEAGWGAGLGDWLKNAWGGISNLFSW